MENILQSLANLFPILMVMGAVYFLLLRPQQQRAKAHEEQLKTLKRKDGVQTSGGILAIVEGVTEEDVHLCISPNILVTFKKASVIGLLSGEKTLELSKRLYPSLKKIQKKGDGVDPKPEHQEVESSLESKDSSKI